MKHTIILLTILTLATFLRFVNYENRWGLGTDQAGFGIVGRYALETKQIPLLGPFSSAGPFQTGGQWYWLVMMGTALFPTMPYAPWMFMGILSVLFVYIIYRAGTLLEGHSFGLLAALLAALSTAQITQSTNLSNQTPIGLFSALMIFCGILYVQTMKKRYAFFTAFFASTAAAIHLQGMAIAPFVLLLPLFAGKKGIKHIPIFLAGGLLPFVPLVLSDTYHNFYSLKNMYYYYRFDQYNISLDVLGRRWKTFLSDFVPHMWGFAVGGYTWAGYLLYICSGFIFLHVLVKKIPLKKEWLLILLSFMGMIVITRYTRTPLFESFVVFLHPFFILLASGITYRLSKISSFLGASLLIILAAGALTKNYEEIKNSTNGSAKEAVRTITFLKTTYPNTRFAIYDFNHHTHQKSLPVAMFLETEGLTDENGKKIGIAFPRPELPIHHPVIAFDVSGSFIMDLSGSTSAQLAQGKWYNVSPSLVYNSVQWWWKNN